MGLDWCLSDKPRPGFEKEFAELEAIDKEFSEEQEKRWEEVSVLPYETLGCLRVGYSEEANRYFLEHSVAERREELQRQVAEKMLRTQAAGLSITRAQLNAESHEVFRLAMEGTPLLGKDGHAAEIKTGKTGSDGEPVMELLRKKDLAAANRAIEIRAKLNGLWIDVSVNDDNLDALLAGKSPAELNEFMRSTIKEVAPNLSKAAKAEEDDSTETPSTEPKVLMQ